MSRRSISLTISVLVALGCSREPGSAADEAGGEYCSARYGPVPASEVDHPAPDDLVFFCAAPSRCGQIHGEARCCTPEQLADWAHTGCGLWHCNDGIQDGDETDTDCGGSCRTCQLLASCKDGSDCVSSMCVDARCFPSCTDGMRDGDEVDVDCGGSCEPCPDRGGAP